MDLKFEMDISKFEKIMDELPKEVRGDAMVKSVEDTARTIRSEMRAAAPVNTGALKKSITSSVKVYNNGSTIFGIIGIDRKAVYIDGNGNKIIPHKYIHLVEINNPFMRSTWERILPTINGRLSNSIAKIINKFNTKGKI